MGNFLNSFKGIEASTQILGLLSKNQAIITGNIANVDTPEYVKKNSNFEEVIGSIRNPLQTELSKKMGPNPLLDEDGGKVNLETELTNMNRNLLYYNMVLRRAGSVINIVKTIGQMGR